MFSNEIDDAPTAVTLLNVGETRQALTAAFVKPDRGSCWNQAMKSSNARLYLRRGFGEETLSRTRVFNRSQSVGLSATIR